MNIRACLLQVSTVICGVGVAVSAAAQQAAPAAATQPAAAAQPASPEAVPAAATPVAAAPVVAQPAAPAVAPASAAEPPHELSRRELRRMPKTLSYREGDEIPEAYVLRENSRRGLVAGGIAAIGAPYIIGLIASGIFSFRNQGGWLGVPVAGPWITWGLRNDDCGNSLCSSEDGKSFNEFVNNMLVIDGIVQGAGLALAIAGSAWTRTELVRRDIASVWIAPTQMGKQGYGITAGGTF